MAQAREVITEEPELDPNLPTDLHNGSGVSRPHNDSGSTRRLMETPLAGEITGKAVYLATHVTPSAGVSASTHRKSLALSTAQSQRTRSPQHFDPEADFSFESKVVTPLRGATPTHSSVLKDAYIKLCAKLRIPPSTNVLKQLGNPLINLSQLKLSRSEFKAVLTALVSDTELVMVDLSSNPITQKEAGYVGELLKSNKYITHLVLSEMSLTGEPLDDLSKTLKTCLGLVSLDLSSNFLGDRDCDSLCRIIEDTDGIRDLVLRQNQLGDCGVALGRAIADNMTLTSLDLSWNHIRGQGAVGIARGLQRNQHLIKVDVSWNGFGFEGCTALTHTLMHNNNLQILNLTSNRIHLPALHRLMDGVCKNKTLTTLMIGLNPIPAHCTSYILDRLRKWKHSNLKEMDLQGVVVDRHFDDILKEIQESRLLMVRYDHALQKRESTRLDPKNIFNIDPVRILFFMKQHLRTIDLFLRIDKDVSGSLSKEEMKYAFELEGYPISDMALDQVMGYLDTNKDGDVDLQEFFDAERRLKREQIKEAEERLQEARGSPNVSLQDLVKTATYSQAFVKPSSKNVTPGMSKNVTPGMSPRSNTFL